MAVYAANSRLQFDQKVDAKCFESWEKNNFHVLPWLACENTSNAFPKYCGIIESTSVDDYDIGVNGGGMSNYPTDRLK